MAIYHLSVKVISRSDGRSATAAAAYRAGAKIADERTGEVHDFTRKRGVKSADLVLPAGAPEWAADRAVLWNAAERVETRKNSRVAREFEIAIPDELSPAERRRLAHDFAREIVERHGCAADVAIHAPDNDGDRRNWHAHILLSTRRLGPDGFGEKTRELDGMETGPQLVTQWRERFASLQNERLLENGIEARVDHRTLEAQGIDREPTKHLGPSAVAYERRTDEPSRRRLDQEQEALARLTRAKELGEQERQNERSIIDISTELAAARAEREAQRERQAAEAREREAQRLVAEAKEREAQRERQAAEAKEREAQRLVAEAKEREAQRERQAAEAREREAQRLAAEAKEREAQRLAAEAKAQAEREAAAKAKAPAPAHAAPATPTPRPRPSLDEWAATLPARSGGTTGWYLGRTQAGHVMARQGLTSGTWEHVVIPQDRKLDAYPPPVGSHVSTYGPERAPKVQRGTDAGWQAAMAALPPDVARSVAQARAQMPSIARGQQITR